MTDEEFQTAIEEGTLPPESFHHRDHVRLAWILLRKWAPAEALVKFSTTLRRYAKSQGQEAIYHETISWAYVLLINERMRNPGEHGPAGDLESFAAAHPELFRWKPSLLEMYYDEKTLHSPLARRIFVFPDRVTAVNLPVEEASVAADRISSSGNREVGVS